MLIAKTEQKGFTLIELLVVIAVIGLLASIVLVSLNTSRAKARDAKRKEDLYQVALAMEMYFDKNGVYETFSAKNPLNQYVFSGRSKSSNINFWQDFFVNPAQAFSIVIPGSICSYGNAPSCASANWPSSIGLFLEKVPVDPTNDSAHYYRFVHKLNAEDYCFIVTKLEQENISLYATKKGIATGAAGMTDCP